VIDQSMIWKP